MARSKTPPAARKQPVDRAAQPDAALDAGLPRTADGMIRVRRIHRRDLNRVWEFLKKVFRLVNRETVEYQRPRTKTRFLEIYEEEGIEQLLFEIREGHGHAIVGYAECAYEVLGSDSWINERYFSNRDMRPLYVEEIAIHPEYQGRGIGSFVIEQLEHLARLRGCTHLVLEVAQNNNKALSFYRARSFYQLDAAIFLAKKVSSEPDLLPPRPLRGQAATGEDAPPSAETTAVRKPRKPADAPVPEDSKKRPRKPTDAPVPEDSKKRPREPAVTPVPEDRKKRSRKPSEAPVPEDSKLAAPAGAKRELVARVRLARALGPRK